MCLSIYQTTETTDSKEWGVPKASPAGGKEEHQSQEQLISHKDSPTCQATLQNETEAKNNDIWDHTMIGTCTTFILYLHFDLILGP